MSASNRVRSIGSLWYMFAVGMVLAIVVMGVVIKVLRPDVESKDVAPAPPMPAPSVLTWEELLESPRGKWAMDLLCKCTDNWSEEDRKKAPAISEWLKEVEEDIDFPWKWDLKTAKENPKGYKKAWRRCFNNVRGKRDSNKKELERQIKDDERDYQEMKVQYDHLTNEIESVNKQITSIAHYPLIVKYTKLEKRKFWFGAKRTPVVKECQRESDFAAVIGELSSSAAKLRSKMVSLESGLSKRKSRHRVCVYWVDVADIAVKEVDKAFDNDLGDQNMTNVIQKLQLRLLGLITEEKKFIDFALNMDKK